MPTTTVRTDHAVILVALSNRPSRLLPRWETMPDSNTNSSGHVCSTSEALSRRRLSPTPRVPEICKCRPPNGYGSLLANPGCLVSDVQLLPSRPVGDMIHPTTWLWGCLIAIDVARIRAVDQRWPSYTKQALAASSQQPAAITGNDLRHNPECFAERSEHVV